MDNIDISYEDALRMAQYMFRNIEDAEDICQEAYMDYISGEKMGKPILYRRMIDAARRINPKYDSRLITDIVEEMPMSTMVEEGEPFDIFHSKNETTELSDMMDTFEHLCNDKALTIINMRIEGYSQLEIAEFLNITQQRVSQILIEVHEKLKEHDNE